MNQQPLIDEEGEVRELMTDDMKLFKPTPEVLPPEVLANLPDTKDKIATTVRFDADVLAYFRATGKDWQNRINEVLREYVTSHQ